MATPSSNLVLSFLMFATGIGIPIMAALNGKLGMQIGSPWAAAFLLFLSGAIIAAVAMLILGRPTQGWFSAPPIFYAGGLLVSFYVLSVTWSAPRIGVGNVVFFVLVGQIFSAAVIDQYGLFGAIKSPLTTQRWIGVALMLIGTFLARRVA
jgi:transporter family-2 protein